METTNRKSSSRTEPVLNGKALYSPKGAAAEYAAVGCNLYTGCKHDCSYCYLKRGVLSHAMGGTEIKLKSCFKDDIDAGTVFTRELEKHLAYLQKVGIFFSFSTDPLITETRDLTKRCVFTANRNLVPVKMLTKNADFIDDDVFMSWLMLPDFRKDLVAFGFTLTGRDDMEPNASTNHERIETMRRLHDMGFMTFASIEPIIDFESSMDVMRESADCCDLYKIGLRSGVKKGYYEIGKCAFFIGQVTGLSESRGFKVYWKESVRKFVRENDDEKFFSISLDLSRNFVSRDYNMFTNK